MEDQVKVFFEQFSSEVSTVASRLFEIVSYKMLPHKKMWIDQADKMITFGTEKNMKGEICYIKPLKDSVNLGFFHGANLSDPNGLLIGTGKLLRHIKFKRLDQIDIDAINELLDEAINEHEKRCNN